MGATVSDSSPERARVEAKPRMEDVARRAGVALGTVSNVLNQPQKVAPSTRLRVQQVIEELGFVPNRAARALAAGTSSTIGFVVIDLSNSFFLDMARGAERAAQEGGMTVVLANSDLQDVKQRTYLQLFSEEQMAGVLLAPTPGSMADLARLKSAGTRVVVLNVAASDACCVTVNNEHGGYLAAKHLIETGRRRLAFAGGPDVLAPLHDRLLGVKRAVEESNGAVTLEVLPTEEVRVEHGREVGAALSRRSPEDRPDGVVAAADLLALGVMQTMFSETGVRFPEDMSLIGYDNNRSAWDSIVPISTVAQPGEEMGAAAAGLLLDELQQPAGHVHRHVELEPTLIVRQSSRR